MRWSLPKCLQFSKILQFSMMKYLAVVLVALVAASSAIIFDRPCRTDIGIRSGFDVRQYLGVWYEIERYEQIFQLEADCVTAQYTPNADGSVRVINRARVLSNGTNIEAFGNAVLSFPNEFPVRGMLNVTFDQFPNVPTSSNYWVVSTDYFQYSVVWGCSNLPQDRSMESFWILSRTPQLPENPQLNARIESLVDRYVDRENIRFTEQNDAVCLDRITPF